MIPRSPLDDPRLAVTLEATASRLDATEAQWREDPRGWWFNDYFPWLEKHVAHLKTVSTDTSQRELVKQIAVASLIGQQFGLNWCDTISQQPCQHRGR